MAKVAFLGLGVMGYPMAGHLSAEGYEVTVYNRTTAKAEAWAAEHGGGFGATPAEAVAGAEIVFACVGNDRDIEQLCCAQDGAFSGMGPGAIFFDHTTASAEIVRVLGARASELGLEFVDAPISGGQAGAEKGVLSVMCGGTEESFSRVAPIIGAYAQTCRRMGELGAGQLAKMVNQICIAGLVQGLSEGMAFAQKAGLDGKAVLDVISKGAAGSWQMENRGETMLEDQFEFGFAVDWMRKDLGIVLDEADRNGALLPVTALVDQFYAEVQRMGGGRWDTSSLMRRLTRDNG